MSRLPFFPSRPDRPYLDFATADFPFPLAVAYARLHLEMDRQEPVAAAWQLRDAGEVLVRFLATLAAADCLGARPDPATAGDLASLLLKPSGLSLGDWHSALELALAAPIAGLRLLPGLGPLFLKPNGRPTDLNRLIDGDGDSFAAWRNAVFGHGVFRQDRAWYAAETLRWLPRLHRLYDAVRPVLDGWELVGLTPGGERVVWAGAGESPPAGRHDHEPWGEPLEMRLERGGETLPLGPLLSVQECAVCREPAAFFFDRNRYESKKDRHLTTFLEYFRGHHAGRRDWAPTRRLATLIPAGFEWERTAYDALEVVEGVRVVFREFEDEYRRPAHLLDVVWRAIDDRPTGYVHLVGPAGVGKTFAVRGLERDGADRDVPVLTYHVLPGALADYRTFMAELDAAARDRFRFRTPGLQAAGGDRAGLAAEFAAWVDTLIRANRLRSLVIAIDGLDELADPAPGAASILDFLPAAPDLPDGCSVVLASRAEVRPHTAAVLERVRAAGKFTTLMADPSNPDSQEAVRAYLRAKLPEQFRDAATVEAVLRRAGGVFLYAYHLCRGLKSGAFDGAEALPEGQDFYPAYLGRLRERVGDALFEEVYLPVLLLLAAAYRPVTLGQLQTWGLPGNRLRFALLDLADFLRVHRVRGFHEGLSDEPGEDRYEIAHEEFLRWVREDQGMAGQWQQTHARIARSALARHADRWVDLDPTDDADLYDLRFTLRHAGEGGLPHADPANSPGDYLYKGWSTLHNLWEAGRHRLVVELLDVLLPRLDAWQGRWAFNEEVASDLRLSLAGILCNASSSLRKLGRLPEALACLERGEAEFRRGEGCSPEMVSKVAQSRAAAAYTRSETLSAMGRLEAALAASAEAVTLIEEAVARWGAEWEDQRAQFVLNHGSALYDLRRHEEAERRFDEVVRACREKGGSDPNLQPLLADALGRHGNVLYQLGRPREAVAEYDEVVNLYRTLTERDGPHVWDVLLAHAIRRRGRVRASVDEVAWPECERDFDEALALYERAKHFDAGGNILGERADCLAEKAVAENQAERYATAVTSALAAVAAQQDLVSAGRTDRLISLAQVLYVLSHSCYKTSRAWDAAVNLLEMVTVLRRVPYPDSDEVDRLFSAAKNLWWLVLPDFRKWRDWPNMVRGNQIWAELDRILRGAGEPGEGEANQ